MTLISSFILKKLLKHKAPTNPLNLLPQLYAIIAKPFSKKPQSLITPKDQNQEPLVSLFKSYGINETQVSIFMKRNQKLASLSPLNIVKPKLDFLLSLGLSHTDLARVLTCDPCVLNLSLNNSLVPSYQLLKSLLNDDISVVYAIKKCPWLLRQDLGKRLVENIEFLRSNGVPGFRISTCLRTQPRALMCKSDGFREQVEEIKGMGFDPGKCAFLVAVQMIGMNRDTWNQKWDIYRKWGCSDDEILRGFRRQPLLMGVSVEKLERVMEFLVNEMGWDVKEVVGCPNVVTHSMENWIIPRCLVIGFLLSKGVIKKDLKLSAVIPIREKQFLARFVRQYCERFPEVLNLYGRSKDSDICAIQVTGVSTAGKANSLTS